MQPEKRLMLAVLLLAVAQQDPHNVKYLNARNRAKRAQQIAAEAADFVRSSDFVWLCKLINVSADWLRKLTPDEGMTAFNKLMSDDYAQLSDIEKETE